MAPTTLTTLVLVVLSAGLLSIASWAWFGSWDPGPPQSAERLSDAEVRRAVEEMRRAIDDYERGRRTL